MPSGIPKFHKYPKTVKDIDMVVFKRVARRLLSDKVKYKELEKFVAQARCILEEVIADVRYEKEYLIDPVPVSKYEHREFSNDPLFEKMIDKYAPVLEKLAQ